MHFIHFLLPTFLVICSSKSLAVTASPVTLVEVTRGRGKGVGVSLCMSPTPKAQLRSQSWILSLRDSRLWEILGVASPWWGLEFSGGGHTDVGDL